MLYQHNSRPSLMRASANFTRPANTTQYASGDLVANSTTAASVTPMSWTVSRTVGGLVKIRRAFLYKNDNDITASSFRLHLFRSSPTVATTGDNGVFASVVSGYDKSFGILDFAVFVQYADGGVGNAAAVDDTGLSVLPMIVQPASGRLIYGLLATRDTYTPASAEVFTVELEFERY